jgi:hypothetical protein
MYRQHYLAPVPATLHDIQEKNNVLADQQADATIYTKPLRKTGLFLTWIPGTRAALFHGEQQVTKGIPEYIRDAAPLTCQQ